MYHWSFFRRNVRDLCGDVSFHYRIATGQIPARTAKRVEAVVMLALLPILIVVAIPTFFQPPGDI